MISHANEAVVTTDREFEPFGYTDASSVDGQHCPTRGFGHDSGSRVGAPATGPAPLTLGRGRVEKGDPGRHLPHISWLDATHYTPFGGTPRYRSIF